MGSKGFIKGLAAGAVLGAVAALVSTVKNKDKKAAAIKKTAAAISDKVMRHAKKLGTLTKGAYGKIVDTTIAEYRGVKALSEEELDELRAELMESWEHVEGMFGQK